MAQPVPFRKFIPADTRDELARKLDDAPREHAEALLSGMQLLQQLHDTGTLDLLRGMVGAGDAVVNHVANIISSPLMVAALRNGLALGTVLGSVDPDQLHTAIQGKPEERKSGTPTLFAILKQMNTEEARLGLSAAARMLHAFGGAIKTERARAEKEGG